MLINTLLGTPGWVWALLVLMVALGLDRTRTRQTGLRRTVTSALVVTCLSLNGTFTVFAGTPLNWVLWAGAAALSVAWFASDELPAGVYYDAATRTFTQPGSWETMAVLLGVFAVRYAIAVLLVHEPAWLQDDGVAAMMASVYGALSGVFLGRLLRLLRLTWGKGAAVPATHANSNTAWG